MDFKGSHRALHQQEQNTFSRAQVTLAKMDDMLDYKMALKLRNRSHIYHLVYQIVYETKYQKHEEKGEIYKNLKTTSGEKM